MENSRHLCTLYLVIAILTATIFVMKCSGEKVREKIKTESVKGSFEDKAPEAIKSDSTYQYSMRDTIIKYYHPVDTVYLERFTKADEVAKTEMYAEAVGKRRYKDTLDNKDIVINYDLNTKGELLDIKFDYEIKPYLVDKPKEPVFSMYGGASLQNTKTLDKFEAFGNVGFQNKQGDIYTVGYGTKNTIQVGYMKKLFTIKK